MTIGQQIRSRRNEKKWTQVHLAWRVGISPSHLSLIENDKRDPSLNILNKLAFAVGARISILWETK